MQKYLPHLFIIVLCSFNAFSQSNITVNSPNGGESWQTAVEQTITWTDNFPEDVKIDLYKGGVFDSELFASTFSDGSKFWTIPVGTTPGSDYKIKITSVDSSNIFDFSDNDFTIFPSDITISSPNGGESWQAGTTQTITWADNIAEDVLIELYKGGLFHSVIVSGTASDGVRNWSIPFTLESGSDYSVKITSVDNTGIFDFSDTNFTIIGNQVTVTLPNGGEDWLIGSIQNITWSDNLVGNIEIQLFKSGIFHSQIQNSTGSDGSYLWNISSALEQGSDYKIKILSVTDGSIYDFSDADFTLSSVVIVTSPNGGENWQTAVEQTITWTDNFPEDVKIDLYKGGVFDSELFASTFSDGSKFWTIPVGTTPGSDYKIKITSVDSSNIFDFSDNDFTIFPSDITISSPNGGESWQAGTTQTITWADNIAEDVLIELYKGGLFHSVIVSGTASDGVRNWSIPFPLESGSDYSVKITSVDNTGIFDFSDTNFNIIGNQVTVTSPNGGEDWLIGSIQNITWSDNLVGNIEIQLFKSGIFHSQIQNSTGSDGSYLWNISSALDQGSDYKIKILSVIDGSIFDFSDADFTLSHEIIVSSPNGGETWQAGNEQIITWSDNINDEVSIELYKGGSFHSIISSSTDSDGLKEWNIPFTLESGSDYQVRISSVVDPTVSDISDSNFTIVGNQVIVTTPNGGEDWSIGSSQKVSWSDNLIGNVEIQLYKGGIFHSIVTSSTTSDGFYTWNISSSTQSGTDFKIRISSVVDGSIFDFSDADFTLSNEIIVTSPNGGESWQTGSLQNIEWDDNLNGNVKIELYKVGVFYTGITGSATSNGEFPWNIPVTIPDGSDYKVKVTSIDDSTVTDFSDADFTIFAGSITVTSPNGGESWLTGSSKDITWSDNISGNVKIDLYKGGSFDSEIISSATSNGSFSWDIPDTTMEGSDYSVKISSVENASLTDFSDADFTIFKGGITVTSPNGGESWQAGTTNVITWADNIAEEVLIELYKGGSFNSVISTSTVSDGSKHWDILFDLESGTDYSVKITSIDNPNLFDFSDSNFTIIGNQVTVTSPNGGENWLAESSQIITWSDNLSGDVEIQLFKGGVFYSSITGSTTSDGLYTWAISSTVESGSDYKIRISSLTSSNIFDFSDADFTIINNDLTITAPNGGENWLTGTAEEITWTDDISGDVKIELFKADVFHSEITPSTPSNGVFTWIIPGSVATGSDYKIKITSVDQPVLFDMSNGSFTIFTGGISVSSPNGGESWKAGTTNIITWADNIAEEVLIDLYKGGSFNSVISISTVSDGSKTWDIPFDLESGNDYTVKITSVDNPGISDFSDSNFTIIGNQITVASPNGGENWLVESSQIITWSDNLSGDIEIQLFKGGVMLATISSSTSSDGSKDWNIPSDLEPGSDYTIRIISVDDPGILDFSDANFTIIGNQITVASPNGGESWLIGDQRNITWSDNLIGNVEIQLFKGEKFHSQIENSTSSDSSFIWNISAALKQGSDYKIKIMKVNEGNIFDFSNENFSLTSEIIVASPNGAEVWQAGTSQTITWTDNLEEDVKIELYKGGVFNSEIINITPSDGSYTWGIPNNLLSGADYKIKISSAVNNQIADFSDSNFTVEGKFITVTSPNNGKIWHAGTAHDILWLDNISENVRIELYKDEVFYTEINPSTSSDGSKLWDIPFLIEGSSNYKIKMTSTIDPGTYDFSDTSFTIVGNQITVTSPNGGENWLIGSLHEITWKDQLDGDVQVLLYKGGVLHTIISGSTPSDGSITWKVPSIEESNDYKIKILSMVTDEMFDESDSNFTFTNFIDVTDQFNGIPLNYGLLQNYPNPFNPTTTIYYALPKEGSVELKIYDVIGNEIMTFSEEGQSAGYHKIQFDAAGYGSGVYFYRLQAGIFVETKKMILLR